MSFMFKRHNEPCTPEEILANCERYGLDPNTLDELPLFWRNLVIYKHRKTGRSRVHHRPWELNCKPGTGRYPYPPGIERDSPEFHRIRRARYLARRRASRTGQPLFLEGFHNLDTYVPVLSTKRESND